jgi:aryl-alcohol dehydrogenase-like predicted oxidoreductase
MDRVDLGGRGFLTGTVDRGALDARDFRARNARFQGEAAQANEAIAEAVRQVAADVGAFDVRLDADALARLDSLGSQVAGDRYGVASR